MFQKSYELHRNNDTPEKEKNMASCLMNVGMSLVHLGCLDEAIENLEESLKVI